MRLSVLAIVASATLSSSFVIVPQTSQRARLVVHSTKAEGDEVQMQQALSKGTIVQFEEKGRHHIGTIMESEHKANGGARYKVDAIDADGPIPFDISDKDVMFAVKAPDNKKKVEATMSEMLALMEASEDVLYKKLDVSPELVEMAWEEAADAESHQQNELTPRSFIKLLHEHKASAIEEYTAWRLLQGETAHVFFKDLKHHGRVDSFKAKARKAVENAKDVFCNTHDDVEFCLV